MRKIDWFEFVKVCWWGTSSTIKYSSNVMSEQCTLLWAVQCLATFCWNTGFNDQHSFGNNHFLWTINVWFRLIRKGKCRLKIKVMRYISHPRLSINLSQNLATTNHIGWSFAPRLIKQTFKRFDSILFK